ELALAQVRERDADDALRVGAQVAEQRGRCGEEVDVREAAGRRGGLGLLAALALAPPAAALVPAELAAVALALAQGFGLRVLVLERPRVQQQAGAVQHV